MMSPVTNPEPLAGEDSRTPIAPSMSRGAALIRLLALAAGLVVVAVASVQTGLDATAVRALVADAGWIGPVLYVMAYAFLTVALVPGALLTASGGVLFGIGTGSLLTLVGATLGAMAAFVIARAAGRPAVDGLVSGRVERVDRWLGDRGLVAVLTLRLVPLVPFNAANYAAGVTAIRLRDFIAGTAVGIVPGVVVYTGLGARASDPTGPGFLVAVGGLVVLAGLGSLAMRRLRTDPGDATDGDTAESDPGSLGCGHE